MAFKFKVELELSDEQLEQLMKDHRLCRDVDEMKQVLTDFAQELSDVNRLSDVMNNLDIFNY